jgi:hypothetical protein
VLTYFGVAGPIYPINIDPTVVTIPLEDLGISIRNTTKLKFAAAMTDRQDSFIAEILQALEEELRKNYFHASYSTRTWYTDPLVTDRDYYIVVMANKTGEAIYYYIRVKNNYFIISRKPSKGKREKYPIEHPNAITDVLQYLDNKCEYGRTLRRSFPSHLRDQ